MVMQTIIANKHATLSDISFEEDTPGQMDVKAGTNNGITAA